MIYLDNAATTFPKPDCVYAEMDRVNRTLAVNTGRGSYKSAREATKIMDDLRSSLLRLFHAENQGEIIFTPSVTHALFNVLHGLSITEQSTVYISPYEHNAVARTLHSISKTTGCKIKIFPLKDDLSIDIERMKYEFSLMKPDIVVTTMVSNVTGYILPVKEIYGVAKEYGAITVMDAAQAAGLMNIDITEIQADICCFAGHKTLQGPFGIAGYYLKHGVPLGTFFTGGTGSDSTNLEMPKSGSGQYEASSPNIIAAAGLLAAVKNIDTESHRNKLSNLTDYLIHELNSISKILVRGYICHDKNIGIVSFVVEGYKASDVGMILDDEFDIAVRTGYHCAPFIHDYINDKDYGGTVRIGLGNFNTSEDIDALISALKTL